MCAKMTRERAEEFGVAWNSRDADLVTSFFAESASVGPDALGKSYIGKDNIRRGVQVFFDRYPDGKFENLKVVVADEIGTFEWDFVTTDSSGQKVRTTGCDLLQFVGDNVALKNAYASYNDRPIRLASGVSGGVVWHSCADRKGVPVTRI